MLRINNTADIVSSIVDDISNVLIYSIADNVVLKSDVSLLNFVVASHIDTVLETALNTKNGMNTTILSDIPSEVKSKARKPSIRQ